MCWFVWKWSVHFILFSLSFGWWKSSSNVFTIATKEKKKKYSTLENDFHFQLKTMFNCNLITIAFCLVRCILLCWNEFSVTAFGERSSWARTVTFYFVAPQYSCCIKWNEKKCVTFLLSHFRMRAVTVPVDIMVQCNNKRAFDTNFSVFPADSIWTQPNKSW